MFCRQNIFQIFSNFGLTPALSTDVGNNYELLFSVSSTYHVTMSNGVQQTEVKLKTQTTQFKPVANYTQSDQVDFSFTP